MTVYAVGLINIHDPARYEPYAKGFSKIWEKYDGSILAVDDKPTMIEGSQWPSQRTIIMSFPDESAFYAWYQSPDYQELVKHRRAAATSVFALHQAFDLQLLDGARKAE